MNRTQRCEVLAARIYANTHNLRVVEEAFIELGELPRAEVVALFEDEGFRERVKVLAWCLERSSSQKEFEERVSMIAAARQRGEQLLPEGTNHRGSRERKVDHPFGPTSLAVAGLICWPDLASVQCECGSYRPYWKNHDFAGKTRNI